MVVAIIVNFDPTLIGAQKFYPETGAIKGAFTDVFFHALHHHDAGGGVASCDTFSTMWTIKPCMSTVHWNTCGK